MKITTESPIVENPGLSEEEQTSRAEWLDRLANNRL